MLKFFKKISYLSLVFVMLLVNFFVPSNMEVVKAKTIRDLKAELEAKQEEYKKSQEQKELTESEISNTKSNIDAINTEISNIQKEMLDLTEEIEKLNDEIIEKEKEIKSIMNYYQLSNGESAYLEYIFNAVDFTDFIYRLAIAEQLSDYNDKLIDEYNDKIKENEKKKVELDEKTVSLNKKQETLQSELKTLRGNLDLIAEENMSIEDEIKVLKEYIDTYQNKYKCGLDEDISVCGRDKLPPDTAFYRPVVSGTISAHFGWYSPWGSSTWHYGTDFAGTGHGAPVYSIAGGKVAGIVYRTSCGGNMVYVQHIVNGQRYTSGYFHLASINVNVGDTVTRNTVIGTVGGDPGIEWWDGCSTGTHLHLQIAYGLYMEDYYNYYGFQAKSFDARLVMNLPGVGTWFSSRDTRY